MNKIKNYILVTFFGLRKKIDGKVAVFLIVIALAIFFRVYKFNDLLLFKGDAFRDAVMISRAVENGAGELPLLGPRAGGTKLRVGPAFYYIQYLSAVTFRSVSPPVLAYPTLLFSLLSIPIFWLLARKFFSRDWSMLLTGLFSLSFLAIEYSRFAWNPNSAPFFNLLFFYALLEIFDEKMARYKNWFAVLAGLALAISTQLHFSNFIALPAILILFLLLHWKKTKEVVGWKLIIFFLLATLIIYSPVILNDAVNKGSNAKQFLKAIESKPSNSSIVKNLVRETSYFGKYFLRITTGALHPRPIYNYAAQILIFLALAINFLLWKREKEDSKKNFLSLSFLIFAVYFLLYIPLAKEIDKPRFFLPLLPLPFIFLGYIGVCPYGESKKLRIIKAGIFSLLALVLVFGSVRWTLAWLGELDKSQNQVVRQEDTLVLEAKKDRVWWTWGHFQKTAAYLSSTCPTGMIYFTLAKDVSDYDHSIEYALKEEKTAWPPKIIGKNVPYDSEGCYFYISRVGAAMPAKPEEFNREKAVDLGNISVTRFTFRDLAGKADVAEERRKNGQKNSSGEDEEHRLYWKSVKRKMFTKYKILYKPDGLDFEAKKSYAILSNINNYKNRLFCNLLR